MTFQSHQSEDATTKPVARYFSAARGSMGEPAFTEEELLAGDRERNQRKNEDPYRQAEADRWIGRES